MPRYKSIKGITKILDASRRQQGNSAQRVFNLDDPQSDNLTREVYCEHPTDLRKFLSGTLKLKPSRIKAMKNALRTKNPLWHEIRKLGRSKESEFVIQLGAGPCGRQRISAGALRLPSSGTGRYSTLKLYRKREAVVRTKYLRAGALG